jgi:hypothetical protein
VVRGSPSDPTRPGLRACFEAHPQHFFDLAHGRRGRGTGIHPGTMWRHSKQRAVSGMPHASAADELSGVTISRRRARPLRAKRMPMLIPLSQDHTTCSVRPGWALATPATTHAPSRSSIGASRTTRRACATSSRRAGRTAFAAPDTALTAPTSSPTVGCENATRAGVKPRPPPGPSSTEATCRSGYGSRRPSS